MPINTPLGLSQQYDWPNPIWPDRFPRENRTWLQQGGYKLLKDKFFGAAGEPPSGNRDWPNPIQPTRYRPPTHFRPLPGAGAPPTPLLPFDWPNPRGYVPSIALRTHIDGQRLLVYGQDLFFGGAGQPPANLDWPVPKGPTQGSIELRTWLREGGQKLLTDKFFGLAGNPNFDWPVPKGAAPGVVTNRTHADGYKVLLFKESIPSLNFDWPNPRGAKGVHQDWSQGSLLGTLLFPAPSGPLGVLFALYDWPNPRGATPAIVLRTHTDAYKLGLFVESIPSLNFDWPVPPGPRPGGITNRTYAEGYKLGLFIESIPYLNLDWPVPKGPAPGVVTNRTHAEGYKVQLFQEIIPFLQFDWPVPPGPRPGSIELRSALDMYKLNLFVESIPSLNFDWPNPRGAKGVHQDWSLGSLLGTLLFPPPAGPLGVLFFQTDWPNPRGYVPNIELRTHLLTLVLSTLAGQDQVPFNQFDWPNPRGAQRSIELLTFIQWLLAQPPIVIQYLMAQQIF